MRDSLYSIWYNKTDHFASDRKHGSNHVFGNRVFPQNGFEESANWETFILLKLLLINFF